MAQTLKFGNGTWATKKGSTLAFNDEDGNYKPLPFTTTRTSIATRVNKEGLIEVVENDRPRIDYTDSADGALLLEPQRTNLITQSELFSDASWGKTATIVGANSIISADGTQNASLIQSTQTATAYVAPNNLTLTIGNTYTFSCFAKKGNNDWIRLAHITSGGTGCWFDLENGVVGTVNSQSATIEYYGNGWYRCTNTFIAIDDTNSDNAFIGICDANGSTNAGIVGKNDYLWGAQLEAGSYLTSYIPTQGSAVTRQADTASGAGNSEVFNDSEGVLFADMSFLENNTSAYNRLSLSDGSSNNRILIYPFSNTQLGVRFNANASQLVSQTLNVQALSNYSKLTIKWGNGNYSLYQNGFEIYSQSISDTPINLSKINFSSVTETNPFYGKTKELAYYNTALTDLELETLTSYRSLNELVTELNLKAL